MKDGLKIEIRKEAIVSSPYDWLKKHDGRLIRVLITEGHAFLVVEDHVQGRKAEEIYLIAQKAIGV